MPEHDDGKSFDPRQLRDALATFATGVTVVTALPPGGKPVAMTVNSFAALSLDPPLVLWSAQKGIDPYSDFVASKHYAVHVLHAGQEELACHFARDIDDKFNAIPYTSGIGGLPLLDDFTARFQCHTERLVEGGDHVILLGRVLSVEHRPAEPLIFHAGRFRH